MKRDEMSKEQLKKDWAKDVEKLLVGKTIKKCRYMTDKEVENHGWNCSPIVIELNDGTCIYPSHDDEGNDGGALFTTDKKLSTIPVIR